MKPMNDATETPNRFRPATLADLDAVLRIMEPYYAEDGYPFDEKTARRTVTTLLADPALGKLFVAELDGRVAGYLAVTFGYSLEYGGRDAFVDELCIAEAARGRGLGGEALELAARICREEGVGTLHLEVELHREGAFELYRRSGFEDGGRRLLTKRLRD
jgi:ribosomal protein S18 acetylase RimI-like enzyme